jgi:hypothetical protein
MEIKKIKSMRNFKNPMGVPFQNTAYKVVTVSEDRKTCTVQVSDNKKVAGTVIVSMGIDSKHVARSFKNIKSARGIKPIDIDESVALASRVFNR